MYRYFGDWEHTGPREVKDGIRAQSRGSKFASSWWGKRWLETLESFGWDSRLQRGRTYARKGQVTDLKLGPGGVTAGVQGSAPRPYRVKIQVQPLTDSQWEEAVAALDEQPLFVGQLLAGEMPAEIEEVFKQAHAALFPQQSRDLEMSCSCPDWAIPCKHLAAVYYVLAEWLDRDPFLLFELRGRDRDALLTAVRERHGSGEEAGAAPGEPEEPLPVEDFWTGGSVELGPSNAAPPPVPLALIRALGDPPGWNETPLARSLGPIYSEVSARAAMLLSGEEAEGEEPAEEAA
jgi:uncharacterized Zn finger protein